MMKMYGKDGFTILFFKHQMKASLFDDTAQGLLAYLNFFWHEKKIEQENL